MIPHQRNGGSFVITAFVPLPARAPANAADIPGFVADLIDPVTGNLVLADEPLTFHAASQTWRSSPKLHSLLDGLLYIQTRFKPTSTNLLIQTWTTEPRAVSDVVKRLAEHEAARAAADAATQASVADVDADLAAARASLEGTGFVSSTHGLKASYDAEIAQHNATRAEVTAAKAAAEAASATATTLSTRASEARLAKLDRDVAAVLDVTAARDAVVAQVDALEEEIGTSADAAASPGTLHAKVRKVLEDYASTTTYSIRRNGS